MPIYVDWFLILWLCIIKLFAMINFSANIIDKIKGRQFDDGVVSRFPQSIKALLLGLMILDP